MTTRTPGEDEYQIKPLNLLAFPKDKPPICCMSDKPATVQLITPHSNFYYVSHEVAEQVLAIVVLKHLFVFRHIATMFP